MRLAPAAAAAFLAGCALGSARVETLAEAPAFRARVLAIGAVRGAAGTKALALSRELARRLQESGIQAASLERSDSVLAGSALSLDVAADPAALSEVRRATGADGIVFLTLDAGWRTLDVAVLDAVTGEAALHAVAHPRGDAFASPEEAAAAAARALSDLAPDRPKAVPAASGPDDDLPVP